MLVLVFNLHILPVSLNNSWDEAKYPIRRPLGDTATKVRYETLHALHSLSKKKLLLSSLRVLYVSLNADVQPCHRGTGGVYYALSFLLYVYGILDVHSTDARNRLEAR